MDELIKECRKCADKLKINCTQDTLNELFAITWQLWKHIVGDSLPPIATELYYLKDDEFFKEDYLNVLKEFINDDMAWYKSLPHSAQEQVFEDVKHITDHDEELGGANTNALRLALSQISYEVKTGERSYE
jgi:hypothetical protein